MLSLNCFRSFRDSDLDSGAVLDPNTTLSTVPSHISSPHHGNQQLPDNGSSQDAPAQLSQNAPEFPSHDAVLSGDSKEMDIESAEDVMESFVAERL